MMILTPLILIGISILLSRDATGSWFSPSSFFGIVWFFYLFFPLVFAPEFEIQYHGIWFISFFVMASSAGAVFISLIFPYRISNSKIQKNFDIKSLYFLVMVFNVITLFGLVSLGVFSYSNYGILYNNHSWLSIPNFISIDRYEGYLSYPLIIKYSLYFMYPGNIISGIILNSDRLSISKKIQCFLPLLFAISLGFIEGSRTSIMLGSILLLSTYFGTRIIENNGKLNISLFKIISYLILFISLFLSFFVFIQWLRDGLDPIIFELMVLRLKAYLFGYLSAFTIWFSNMESLFVNSLSLSTFAGPMNLLGLMERELGFYSPVNINQYSSTNIFTAFRGIINDFTWVGAIFLSFLLGIFFQLEFQKLRKKYYNGILSVSIFYSFSIYSPLISIFHYNSIFFSWVFIFLILKLIDKK